MKNGLSKYFDLAKHGAYVAIKPTEKGVKTIKEIQAELNVKEPVAAEDLKVIIAKGNWKQAFVPYSEILRSSYIMSYEVGSDDALYLRLLSPELNERCNELKYLGYNSESVYCPYIKIANKYRSESLREKVIKDKTLEFQEEVYNGCLELYEEGWGCTWLQV